MNSEYCDSTWKPIPVGIKSIDLRLKHDPTRWSRLISFSALSGPAAACSTLSGTTASCLTLSGPTAACWTLSGAAVACLPSTLSGAATSCSTLSGPAAGRRPFNFVRTSRRRLNLVRAGHPLPAQSCPVWPSPAIATLAVQQTNVNELFSSKNSISRYS